MTHDNRGRITVDKAGNWRLYTNTLPGNSAPLGVVSRDVGDAGALVRIEATGQLVQVNAGVIRTLDQRKVTAALATSEPRPIDFSAAKSLPELCRMLNEADVPQGFDFASLPTFGPRPEWLADDSLVASWDAGSVIALPERAGDRFIIQAN